MNRARRGLRILLGVVYAAAGILHLIFPEPFLGIIPDWVKAPEAAVAVTGIAELAGAAGLLQGRSRALRQAAGAGLALYAVGVFPANIQHFANDLTRADQGLGLGYHIPRLLAQPVIAWAALWAGGVTDWPFRRR